MPPLRYAFQSLPHLIRPLIRSASTTAATRILTSPSSERYTGFCDARQSSHALKPHALFIGGGPATAVAILKLAQDRAQLNIDKKDPLCITVIQDKPEELFGGVAFSYPQTELKFNDFPNSIQKFYAWLNDPSNREYFDQTWGVTFPEKDLKPNHIPRFLFSEWIREEIDSHVQGNEHVLLNVIYDKATKLNTKPTWSDAGTSTLDITGCRLSNQETDIIANYTFLSTGSFSIKPMIHRPSNSLVENIYPLTPSSPAIQKINSLSQAPVILLIGNGPSAKELTDIILTQRPQAHIYIVSDQKQKRRSTALDKMKALGFDLDRITLIDRDDYETNITPYKHFYVNGQYVELVGNCKGYSTDPRINPLLAPLIEHKYVQVDPLGSMKMTISPTNHAPIIPGLSNVRRFRAIGSVIDPSQYLLGNIWSETINLFNMFGATSLMKAPSCQTTKPHRPNINQQASNDFSVVKHEDGLVLLPSSKRGIEQYENPKTRESFHIKPTPPYEAAKARLAYGIIKDYVLASQARPPGIFHKLNPDGSEQYGILSRSVTYNMRYNRFSNYRPNGFFDPQMAPFIDNGMGTSIELVTPFPKEKLTGDLAKSEIFPVKGRIPLDIARAFIGIPSLLNPKHIGLQWLPADKVRKEYNELHGSNAKNGPDNPENSTIEQHNGFFVPSFINSHGVFTDLPSFSSEENALSTAFKDLFRPEPSLLSVASPGNSILTSERQAKIMLFYHRRITDDKGITITKQFDLCRAFMEECPHNEAQLADLDALEKSMFANLIHFRRREMILNIMVDLCSVPRPLEFDPLTLQLLKQPVIRKGLNYDSAESGSIEQDNLLEMDYILRHLDDPKHRMMVATLFAIYQRSELPWPQNPFEDEHVFSLAQESILFLLDYEPDDIHQLLQQFYTKGGDLSLCHYFKPFITHVADFMTYKGHIEQRYDLVPQDPSKVLYEVSTANPVKSEATLQQH